MRNREYRKKREESKNYLRKEKNFQHVMDARSMFIDLSKKKYEYAAGL